MLNYHHIFACCNGGSIKIAMHVVAMFWWEANGNCLIVGHYDSSFANAANIVELVLRFWILTFIKKCTWQKQHHVARSLRLRVRFVLDCWFHRRCDIVWCDPCVCWLLKLSTRVVDTTHVFIFLETSATLWYTYLIDRCGGYLATSPCTATNQCISRVWLIMFN